MDTRFLTPCQVAKLLQVTEHTVYEWLRAGELASIKLGRLWRVSEDDLAAFLDKRRSPSRSRATNTLGPDSVTEDGAGGKPRPTR